MGEFLPNKFSISPRSIPQFIFRGEDGEKKKKGRARKCHIRRTHITEDTRFGGPSGYAGTKLPPVSSVSDRRPPSPHFHFVLVKVPIHGTPQSFPSLLKSHQRNAGFAKKEVVFLLSQIPSHQMLGNPFCKVRSFGKVLHGFFFPMDHDVCLRV